MVFVYLSKNEEIIKKFKKFLNQINLKFSLFFRLWFIIIKLFNILLNKNNKTQLCYS